MKKNLVFLVISTLLLVTTGIVYIPKFLNQGLHGIELTFLANLGSGLLLLYDGIQGICKKNSLPQYWYLTADVIMIGVLLVCLYCIGEANFSGPFLFLHILNPIIFTILVVTSTYQGPIKLRKACCSILIITILYLIYVIAYGYQSGDWLYSIINIPEKGLMYVLLFSTIVLAIIQVIGFIIYHISKWYYLKSNE